MASVVSFDVKRGDIVVITGRIGSGKTTLVRSLLGLLPRDAGEIAGRPRRLRARPISSCRRARLYRAGAAPVQRSSLRDNLLLGMPEGSVDIAAAMRTAVMDARSAGA